MQSVGLPWYTAETYPLIRDTMSDGDNFPASYSDWLSEAERERKRLERSHGIVHCISIDPQAFAAWCRVNDLPPDAAARMLFAERAALRQHRMSA